MTRLSRSEMSATDDIIATHAANRAAALQRLEETGARIAELTRQISESEFDVARAAELIAGGKFEIPQAQDVSGLRAELSRLESAAAALTLGLEKIEAAIMERESSIDEDFLRKVTSMQAESLNWLFEAMLAMAEAAQNELALRRATRGDLALRINRAHTEFWRSKDFFPVSCVTSATAKEYLEVFARDVQKSFGFVMSNKQAARLAALAI